MTLSLTRSATASRTDAEYLASKIAGDLWLLYFLYKKTSEQYVRDHITEAVELIANGYLRSLDYGFKRNGIVIFRLRYEVHWDGSVSRDDECGDISAGMNLDGATAYSYLSPNSNYFSLTAEQQAAFDAKLPVKRNGADEPPLAANGVSSADRQYAKNGTGVSRTVFNAT
jgi:hypothetical protein